MTQIFVSYSRADSDFANRLVNGLRRFGLMTWIDVENIPAGSDWSSEIDKALRLCDLMILVVSPKSMSSTNVADEWQYFRDNNKPIVPIVVEGTAVNFRLNRLQQVDFTSKTFDLAFKDLLTQLSKRGLEPSIIKGGDEVNQVDELAIPIVRGPQISDNNRTLASHPNLEFISPETPWVVTLVGDSSHGFFSTVIKSIIDTLGKFRVNGFPLNTIIYNHDDQVWTEESLLQTFLGLPVSGLIIAPASSENTSPNITLLDQFIRKGVPVIQVDRKVTELQTPWVGIDNVGAGHKAGNHLLMLGHKRIATIGGRPYVLTNKQRLDGVRKAVDDNGATTNIMELWGCSQWESSRTVVKELLAGNEAPTALFCFNGMATLGAFLALRDLKLKGPGDIAIVGFDDNPWCLLPDVSITVVRQPAIQIGEKTAELMWQGLHNNLFVHDYFLPYELIVRDSCGSRS